MISKGRLEAKGVDWKGTLSIVLYLAAVGLSFVHQAIGGMIYLAFALMWLIPDPRIERALKASQES